MSDDLFAPTNDIADDQFAASKFSGVSLSIKEIAAKALPIIERVLHGLPEATQAQWAEDLMMFRMTQEESKQAYAKKAENTFVLQGFCADLIAIEAGRPRLREVFPSIGPSFPNEVPEYARRFFEDASTGGMFTKQGRIESGVARRRVHYSNQELSAALESVYLYLDTQDAETLKLAEAMIASE